MSSAISGPASRAAMRARRPAWAASSPWPWLGAWLPSATSWGVKPASLRRVLIAATVVRCGAKRRWTARVARLTSAALTPGMALSTPSALVTHDAQCRPATSSRSRSCSRSAGATVAIGQDLGDGGRTELGMQPALSREASANASTRNSRPTKASGGLRPAVCGRRAAAPAGGNSMTPGRAGGQRCGGGRAQAGADQYAPRPQRTTRVVRARMTRSSQIDQLRT
jgi:hypothetical protein